MTTASNSRRTFLKAATLSALSANGLALTGCIGQDSAPDAQELQFALGTGKAGAQDDYFLQFAGQQVLLQPHTEASLGRLMTKRPGLASGPASLRASHFAEGVSFADDRVLQMHVTRRPAGDTSGLRQLMLVHIKVPQARLNSEIERVMALRNQLGEGLPVQGGLNGGLGIVNYGDNQTPISTAIAIVFHHPDLVSMEPQSAATILAHIHTSRFLPELWSLIAYKSGTSGGDDSWCAANPILNDATGKPFLDEFGSIVYDFEVSEEVLALAGAVIRDVLQTTKADEVLRGKLWTTADGVASRPIDAPVQAGAGAGNNTGYTLAASLANGQRSGGCTFETRLFDASTRSIEVKIENDFSRYLGLYVEFFDQNKNRLTLSDSQWSKALPNQLFPAISKYVWLQTEQTRAVDFLAPTSTLLGFPVLAGRLTRYVRLPEEAASARMILGSLGQGVFRDYQPELIGVAGTLVFNYAIPGVFLACGLGITETQSLIDILDGTILVDCLTVMLKSSKNADALVNPNTSQEERNAAQSALNSSLNRLMLDLANNFAKLLLNGAVAKLLAWLVSRIAVAQVVMSIPFVGWGFRAASVAVTVATIVQTTVQVASNPSQIDNLLSLGMNLNLTIHRDLKNFTFPASATAYEVRVHIAGKTFYTTGPLVLAAGGLSEAIQVALPNIPSGGTGRIYVLFTGENGLLVGKGFAATYAASAAKLEMLTRSTKEFDAVPQAVVARLQPLVGRTFADTPALLEGLTALLSTNDVAVHAKSIAGRLANIDIALKLGSTAASSTLEVECTIQEQLVPLTSTTRYQHKRKLQYVNNRYAWQAGTQAPAPARPTCDNFDNALCELPSITLAQRSGQLGYAWRSASAGLKVCGTGVASTQVYTVQNISLGEDPNLALRALTLNGNRCGIVEGAGVVYQLDGPADGSGANFLLDGRSGTLHVRRFNNAAADSLELAGQTLSMGTFSELPTSVAWHYGGYLVGVNAARHKLEVINLNREPVSDIEASPALIFAGLGVRPGLLRGPTCVASSLDGKILVLEALINRVQAFDVHGEPVRAFSLTSASAKTATFALRDQGAAVTYRDMGVEARGYVYVLSHTGSGTQATDFNLDIYSPEGRFVSNTNGFSAARMVVDLWRNVHTLNWETMRGQDGRTEPTVSEWIPSI